MTWRNCSGVSRVAGTAVPIPALLTRMSTRPSSAIAASTSAWQSSGEETSVRHGDGAASERLDLRLGLPQLVDAARAQGHVGPGLGQRLGEGDPEARGGAGHHGDLAVEAEQVEHGHEDSRGSVARARGRARGGAVTRLPRGRAGHS